MEPAAADIGRLPEELLAEIISLTSPPDAGRAAAVSRAILAAADSDAVWSRLLPRDLPRSAAERSLMALPSYKARFLQLSDDPGLLIGGITRISAKALNISGSDELKCWSMALDTFRLRNSKTCDQIYGWDLSKKVFVGKQTSR